MPTAIWNQTIIAKSLETVEVEGNHYFPVDTLIDAHFRPSETRTRCFWKGDAHYYDIVVDGKINKDAAWYYPEPLEAAVHIKDRVAFWKGVQVS